MPVRLLIVDDHEIVREGIRSILKARPDWEICGEASNGREGIATTRALKPDVIIMDISMPVMSGLEATSQIVKLGLPCRILIFTTHESERLASDVQQSGAQGYVVKSQAARNLIAAIESLLAGGSFFGGNEPSEASAEGNTASPGIIFFFRTVDFSPA